MLKTKVVRKLGFERKDLEKTTSWFERHGQKAILLGRCIPIIRSLVSIPAGMAGIRLPVFLIYTVTGSAVWNIFLISLGAFMGNSWNTIRAFLRTYSSATRFLLILFLLFFLFRRMRKSHGPQA